MQEQKFKDPLSSTSDTNIKSRMLDLESERLIRGPDSISTEGSILPMDYFLFSCNKASDSPDRFRLLNKVAKEGWQGLLASHWNALLFYNYIYIYPGNKNVGIYIINIHHLLDTQSVDVIFSWI